MKKIEDELKYVCDGILNLSAKHIRRLKAMQNDDSIKTEYYIFTASLAGFLDTLDDICAQISQSCLEADRTNDAVRISRLGALLNICLEYRSYAEEYITATEKILGTNETDVIWHLILNNKGLTRKTASLKTCL